MHGGNRDGGLSGVKPDSVGLFFAMMEEERSGSGAGSVGESRTDSRLDWFGVFGIVGDCILGR